MIRNLKPARSMLPDLASAALLFSASAPSFASESAASGDWRFGAEIYFWGASIGGESTTGSDIDIGIDRLLENLGMALMGGLAAQREKWTLAADVTNLNVSADKDSTLRVPVGPGFAVSDDNDVKLKGWIVTSSIQYNPIEHEQATLDVLGEARYLWLDSELKVTIRGLLGTRSHKFSDSGGVWDAIAGIRGSLNLTDIGYGVLGAPTSADLYSS